MLCCCLVLAEQITCWVWVRWPLIFSSPEGQYLDALTYVRPGRLGLVAVLDSGKPGGVDGEARGCMEVSH